jgi:alkanesulfonate monooxygenase SsuD/methylene tetrahydromethanopterin reductase-like flavin-dependent oxidoreductase (luciferase family)
MRYGFVVPYADSRDFADLASLGEEHGWDGIFTWEALWGVHAWVSLAAAAMVTSRIRFGTLLTPAGRWRPWDLASAVGTVDRLSGGRVVLSAGLGATHGGVLAFEPDEGRRVRAEKLDECLAIYDGLMRGQPFSFEGTHYSAKPTDFQVPDPSVQRPRPPVWLVGARVAGRERQPSLDRAARWDGLLPTLIDGDDRRGVNSPDELAGLVAQVRQRRAELGLAGAPYDVIMEADSSSDAVPYFGLDRLSSKNPADWAAAGATWWIESWWSVPRGPEGLAEVRRRVQAGPSAVGG